ncbi:hypothetical protein GCM10019059_32230 [Camelimonas fluminis]|uniref:DUF3383 domain-containing protein n=1 Tax=Camelimonas fluminis TaxID=1576911 RepID=A0ABV7UHL8_9HYPH|nr:DUF3383 domain-containing protein [Camelimonas fluminis]GHE70018.1 hypothetical protein GCM10019059_32230 [Camelimonas fluminis]
MAKGLSVNGVVNVTINMSPMAAGRRNFGALLIVGPSPVIDTAERIREYAGIEGIAQDFGTSSPEYAAASLFFSQAPKPAIVYLGRWAQTASAAVLHGGVLSAAQQQMSNFTSITDGAFKIDVDGVSKTVTAVDLSAETNLNGVASKITAKLTGATVVWDAVSKRFSVTSGTTGVTSALGYGTAPTSGTDLSALIGITSATASAPVDGVAAESLLDCVTALADMSSEWYGLMVAAPGVAEADHLAVAAFIEAASQSRVYGVTTQNPNVLDPVTTADIASQMEAAKYKRTLCQYSSSSPYAIASLYGRAFTVDFTGNNTTITLKFKQEPGVVAETITESQAATLKDKNCNVFVNYNNDTAIIQEGVMANGYFIDEVHGTDWLQNAVQTDVYNLLYQSQTKIPQTDEGNHLIVTRIEQSLVQAVTNGLVAPGTWNVDGFGQLRQGDLLPKGFYVFAPPISTQVQSDREARKSVPIQVAAKLAGAIHSVNVMINVNR